MYEGKNEWIKIPSKNYNIYFFKLNENFAEKQNIKSFLVSKNNNSQSVDRYNLDSCNEV